MACFPVDTRSQRMGGQREKFVRFQNDFESKRSMGSEDRLSNYGFNSDNFGRTSSSISSSVRRGLEKKFTRTEKYWSVIALWSF